MSAPVRESGEADHPFAPACDRREIDPASAVSAAPNPSRSGSIVPTRLTRLRGCGTPETVVVTNLVRTHTSPETSQAHKRELAGL